MKKQIVILILLFIAQSATAENLKWEFKIELSKENYLLHENIWLDVTITNISADTLVSAQRIVEKGLGFNFVVTDSLGNKIENLVYYSGASYTPKAYLVAPGEEIYRCYNLGHSFRTLPYTTGSYTIQGFIDLPFENKCYFDNLTSNKLKFNVIEPTGIEKDAYELKLKACEKFIYCTSPEAVQIYQQLFEKFPNSVYAEEAFRAIKKDYLNKLFYQGNKDFDDVEIGNKILFQYPNSGDSKNRLESIFDMDNRRDGGEKLVGKEKSRFLNGIIRVVPNTRLAKFAKQMLQRDRRIEVFDKCESVIDTIPKWELKIELSKEKYFLFEPIWLDVTITNISSDTLKSDCIIAPNHLGFNFIIKDSLGNKLEYTGPVSCYTTSNKTHIVGPNEQVYRCFKINSLYSAVNIFPNRYTIQAINEKSYYNPYLFDNLTSNEILFSIIELSTEEQKVFDLMEEAKKLWRQKDTDSSGRKYQEILDRYPNSVFSEQCFRSARVYTNNAIGKFYHEGGPNIHKKLYPDMLYKFPNSGNTRGWIGALTRELEAEKKVEKLNQIIIDYPNTRAAKFAKQMLLRDSRKQVPK